MKLIAQIAYFDETVENLRRAVDDVARLGATHVVAVDGAYALFPGGSGISPNYSQVMTVLTTQCRLRDLGLTLHVPHDVFAGNEVEKRQLMLDLALAHADPHVDWIMPYDADFHLDPVGARDLKPDLEVLGLAGARWADVEVNETERDDLGWYAVRLLWRAIPGMRFVRNHYTVRYPNGTETIVQPRRHDAPGHQLDVRIRHRQHDRQDGRRQKQVVYYDRRAEEGIES